jgi:hypothetical protein
MKLNHFILFCLQVCISLPVGAQNILQSNLNLPRPGDEIIKQQVPYKAPSGNGENVIWNFSDPDNPGEAYKLTYDTIDGVLTGIEHRTRYYYGFSGDSLWLTGYENATTLMRNIQPEFVRKFPVSYNDSAFTYFRGQGRYGDRLQVDMMGTVFSRADACGQMILPGNDTLKQVLRIKTVKRVVKDIQPLPSHILPGDTLSPVPTVSGDSINYRLQTDDWVMEIETYQWYAQGYRYPVFETVKSRNLIGGEAEDYFATAFFYPPPEHYYLETDSANRSIAEQDGSVTDNPLSGTTFNAFPNPADATLNIEIFLPAEAEIKIQMRSVVTKSLYINEDEGAFPAGNHSFRLNVSQLPPGYYLLNILANNYLLSEIILKQ